MFALLFSALLVSANANSQFVTWMNANNKIYNSTTELLYRQSVFVANLERIRLHNLGNHTWTMGVNKFADLTSTEFRAKYITGGYKAKDVNYVLARSQNTPSPFLPPSVDWEAKGAVTPVKNQGQCGSCWAFSTTGSVEGAYFLKNGTLYSLSEQQLVDCSDAQGNQGCNGGLMDYAFAYIIKNKGITSEANYPYTAEDGTCNKKAAADSFAMISKFTDVTPNSDDELMAAIVQQPVSVAVIGFVADAAAAAFAVDLAALRLGGRTVVDGAGRAPDSGQHARGRQGDARQLQWNEPHGASSGLS